MTNPIGIHALVWSGDWTETSARSAMKRTAEAGYDLIEVAVLDPAKVDAAMTKELATEYGLGTTFSTGLGFDTDISSDDPNIVRAGQKLLFDALDVVTEAGSDYLGGVIFSAMGKYTRVKTTSGRANAVSVLHDLGEAAKERGVSIGLEAVNRYETNLMNTAEQALALIEDIDSDAVTVHLDAYHMNIEERDMATPVRRCAEMGKLGYVHIGESHRGYLGGGSVDLGGLFRALHDVGYDGYIVFESFSSVVVSEEFTAALGIWREPWQDADDLAQHARRYIDTQMRSAAAVLAD